MFQPALPSLPVFPCIPGRVDPAGGVGRRNDDGRQRGTTRSESTVSLYWRVPVDRITLNGQYRMKAFSHSENLCIERIHFHNVDNLSNYNFST